MRKKRFRTAFWVLGCLLLLALFRDVLANGRPLYCRIDGAAYFPGLRTVLIDKDAPYSQPALRRIQQQEQTFEAWKNLSNYDELPVFAPIPFTPGEYSRQNANAFLRPGDVHPNLSDRFRHWLGTEEGGRDVAAGIVGGARIAVLVGLLSMGIAGVLGLLLGAFAGFWGDDQLRVSKIELWSTLAGIPIAFFFAVSARKYALDTAQTTGEWGKSLAIFILVASGFYLAGKFLGKISGATGKVTMPVDLILMRLTEIFNAVPKLIFILVIAALLPKDQSIWVLIALIGFLSWTDVALFVRAELLRVRELDYVTAARGLGLSELRIFLRHALPNALRPALVIFAFGIAGAILLESVLSFLGFGGDALKGISWGSLLDSVRARPAAWWVAIPPGLAIAITILTINKIGELLSEKRS